MTVLVDSSVLIDHLRSVPAATQALADALDSEERIFASLLSRVELRAGAPQRQRGPMEALFAALEWVAVDEHVAQLAGDYAERFGRSHRGVDPVDYVVASSATAVDAELWTMNLRHFPMFPELRAPY